MGQDRLRSVERELGLSGDDVRNGRRAPPVRPMRELDADHGREQLGSEMCGLAVAAGRIVQRARARLGERNQLAHAFRRHARMDDEQQRSR